MVCNDLLLDEVTGVTNITNQNLTTTKCYYNSGSCYSFYLHYVFEYEPVEKNRILNCSWEEEKNCTEILGEDILFLNNITLLTNGSFNYTGEDYAGWHYRNETYEYIQPPEDYRMFQKGCTDKVKSFCFEAEEFENETTGEKEWTEREDWQINVTAIKEEKEKGRKAYVDCQYYTCNKALDDEKPCNHMFNDKHLLGSSYGMIPQLSLLLLTSICSISLCPL
ncbi:uncharacterized protein LOC134818989 [Bolinopsis microptera]|uniref:uncharacterized protein LOC134818989 n=1 Tax=Bolinopsis microptera TaxID=2820187 RepID=UPI00307908A1